MSEGSLCVSNRPGRALEWSGQLSGCAYQYTYQARTTAAAPPRQVLQKTDVAQPTGPQVIVTDASGKSHIFTAP